MTNQERMELLQMLAAESQYNSPEKNMSELLGILDDSEIVPEPDKYYVFIYKAKTRGVKYDAHPLVLVTAVFNWGFIGYNIHWRQSRQYTWGEVVSNLYELTAAEAKVVTPIPIARFKTA